MDGTYTAVVDRFEGDLAVLVLERDGEAVDDVAVEADSIPEEAGEGAVLEVVLEDGWLVDATYQPEATRTRREDAQDRFDALASRPPDDDE